MTANWVFIVLAAMVLAGMVARVPCEEQMMMTIGEFGDDYRACMKRAGRFFPRWSAGG